MENRKHERPVSEAPVFCLEQYDCEMAPAMSNCKTKPSHKVSTWPKCQRRLLFAIVDVGGAALNLTSNVTIGTNSGHRGQYSPGVVP